MMPLEKFGRDLAHWERVGIDSLLCRNLSEHHDLLEYCPTSSTIPTLDIHLLIYPIHYRSIAGKTWKGDSPSHTLKNELENDRSIFRAIDHVRDIQYSHFRTVFHQVYQTLIRQVL